MVYDQTILFPLPMQFKSRLTEESLHKLTLPKSIKLQVRTTLAVWADTGRSKSVHTAKLHCVCTAEAYTVSLQTFLHESYTVNESRET